MAILFGRNQLPVFISFLICGIISGIVYDLFRIKRRIVPANSIVIFFDDIIFMLFNAVLVVFNAYAFNNGNLKWYEFPLLLMGFTAYRLTLSVLFIKIVFKVIDVIKHLVQKLVFKPVRILLCKFKRGLLRLFEAVYLKLFFCRHKSVFLHSYKELRRI